MKQVSSSMAPALKANQAGATEARLHGCWLVVARIVWVVVAVFTLAVFIASLPVVFADLQGLCTAAVCVSRQLSPAQAHTLQQAFGLSLHGYATLSLVILVISSSVWLACGFLVFWRKSNDWMVLLFALICITQVLEGPYSPAHELAQSHSLWLGPANLLSALGTIASLFLIALFPSGRFVPRWTGWIVIGFVAIHVLLLFIPTSTLVSFLLGTWLFFGVAVILVVAQIYRYRRVSTAVQRQQTKWVVLSLTVLILVLVGAGLPSAFFPTLLQPSSLYNPALYLLSICLIPLLAVGFSIAMLRYRLWDIDIIINRTLVYGSLTILLVAIYVGLILASQAVVRAVTGSLSQSPPVIVGSTLAIAALFQPLRKRIQAIIDRRFYRKKYDAQKTLAAFNATLRNEVDLATLSEQLVAVVEETMQPAHISLWLRPVRTNEKQSGSS